MKILVTGSNGFIAKNLIAELKTINSYEIYEYSKSSTEDELDAYCQKAEFVFHLAGINRPDDPSEFMKGNVGLTESLIEKLKRHQNTCPLMISSSTQATLDNPYGESKRAGEDVVFRHGTTTGARVLVYRFPNVFGKWCRPSYNSAVATFCHNIAHDLPIKVNDPEVELNLVYIDDLVQELVRAVEGRENRVGEFCEVPVTHKVKLGKIVDYLEFFKTSRELRAIPNMSDGFEKKLYSTYLSYLPKDEFSYPLKMNVDHRGSFTEFIKTPERGQVSVNISKPGITKGNHWHHSKNEKFLVVSGHGVIRFRNIYSDEIIEYFVSGDKLEVVDIPTGYTHNIENLGETDMVTIMWANEAFDPEHPDTYFLEV